jgi:hypothetical protein
METKTTHPTGGAGAGPKYYLDIDGVEHEWDQATITVPQLRELGGIPAGTQVVEIDADETERTLEENAIIQLQPGHRYGKKVRWKRG